MERVVGLCTSVYSQFLISINLKYLFIRIRLLTKRDTEKKEQEAMKNDLETFIFDLQDKLYQDLFEKCSTEDEREKYRTELSEASDWLYEQDSSTTKTVRNQNPFS